MRTPVKAAGAAGALLMSIGGATVVSASVPVGSDEPAASGEVGTIIVGSADFPESQLLGEIYGQALEGAGFDVAYELAIGPRETYYGAIEAGEVHLVPEYTNSLLSFLLAPDLPEAADVGEQLDALDENLPEGLEVLTPSTAEDKDTIVCTAEVIDEFGLTNLSDLAEASTDIVLGAPPEFEERTPFGLAGFSEVLGAEFAEFVPLAPADVVDALSTGAVDCGNIFSTSSAIATNGFVALDDDQGLVPAEAVLPLIRSEVATPEAVAALDAVNAALDTEILTGLVAQVEVDAVAPEEVAAEWLAGLADGGADAADGSLPVVTG